MSRGFLASPDSRDFKRSQNRNRIIRAGIPITSQYSFCGLAVAEQVVTPFTFPPFQPPEYGNASFPPVVLPYNQQFDPSSLPFDVFPDLFTTVLALGERLRLTFRVSGLFEAYPINDDTPIESGFITVSGQRLDFQYFSRPPAFLVRLRNAAFAAQPDAFDDPRGAAFQPWLVEVENNPLVVNAGVVGIGGLATVTADVTITRAGPFQGNDFTMSAQLKRALRTVNPANPPPWTQSENTQYHRRNVANENPPNPLVSQFNCIPFGPSSGTGSFGTGYFQGGSTFYAQADCQWCWVKIVNIVRL